MEKFDKNGFAHYEKVEISGYESLKKQYLHWFGDIRKCDIYSSRSNFEINDPCVVLNWQKLLNTLTKMEIFPEIWVNWVAPSGNSATMELGGDDCHLFFPLGQQKILLKDGIVRYDHPYTEKSFYSIFKNKPFLDLSYEYTIKKII